MLSTSRLFLAKSRRQIPNTYSPVRYLFPSGQIKNLYVGPLDFTLSGQAISLVDFHAPDFERFPRFKLALQHAQVAELEPGDAIYIPSLWFHHVESFDPLSILMNYWWRPHDAYPAGRSWCIWRIDTRKSTGFAPTPGKTVIALISYKYLRSFPLLVRVICKQAQYVTNPYRWGMLKNVLLY